MPRIVGVDIPKEKRIEVALTYLFGVGLTTSGKVLKSANVDPNKRARELTEEEISRITSILQKDLFIEGDLRREISANIKRLMSIGSYRGQRHKKGLPVRGQRTHTNARTRKGPKRAAGIKRKK